MISFVTPGMKNTLLTKLICLQLCFHVYKQINSNEQKIKNNPSSIPEFKRFIISNENTKRKRKKKSFWCDNVVCSQQKPPPEPLFKDQWRLKLKINYKTTHLGNIYILIFNLTKKKKMFFFYQFTQPRTHHNIWL
jgi:hypothetical protein